MNVLMCHCVKGQLLAKPAQRATSIRAAASKIASKNYFSILNVLAGSQDEDITTPRQPWTQRLQTDLARPGPPCCYVATCGPNGTTESGLCQPQGSKKWQKRKTTTTHPTQARDKVVLTKHKTQKRAVRTTPTTLEPPEIHDGQSASDINTLRSAHTDTVEWFGTPTPFTLLSNPDTSPTPPIKKPERAEPRSGKTAREPERAEPRSGKTARESERAEPRSGKTAREPERAEPRSGKTAREHPIKHGARSSTADLRDENPAGEKLDEYPVPKIRSRTVPLKQYQSSQHEYSREGKIPILKLTLKPPAKKPKRAEPRSGKTAGENPKKNTGQDQAQPITVTRTP